MASISNLHPELVTLVANRLPLRSLASLFATSRYFRNTARPLMNTRRTVSRAWHSWRPYVAVVRPAIVRALKNIDAYMFDEDYFDLVGRLNAPNTLMEYLDNNPVYLFETARRDARTGMVITVQAQVLAQNASRHFLCDVTVRDDRGIFGVISRVSFSMIWHNGWAWSMHRVSLPPHHTVSMRTRANSIRKAIENVLGDYVPRMVFPLQF